MRRIIHRPSGGAQLNRPSGLILDVRSVTLAFGTATAVGTSGVGKGFKSGSAVKAALSSNQFTRAPVCRTNSEILWSVGGAREGKPSKPESGNHSGGLGPVP